MKKYLVILIVIVMCLSMASCSDKEDKLIQSATQPQSTQAPQTQQETVATQAPTQPPTEAPTQDDSWKKLYINQLNSLNKDEFAGFLLVQVDGDDIPELLAESNSRITSSYLYWVYNNQLCEYATHINGFSYVNKGNLFMSVGGFQGCCFEEILSIDGNTTKLRSKGEYVIPEITGYESYKWNDTEMAQIEYETAKLALFDKSTSITPTTYYSYSDICQQITQW